jgi:AraC family transcriptional regulator
MAADTKIETASAVQLEAPRMMDRGALLLAGLREHYSAGPAKEIPALWQRLAPSIGRMPGQVGRVAYGVVFRSVEGVAGFDYMAGVEVARAEDVGREFVTVRIPALRYAVFAHRGHVSELTNTICAAVNVWLPESGYAAAEDGADAPGVIEYYGEHFDPQTGMNDIEVWVAVKA